MIALALAARSAASKPGIVWQGHLGLRSRPGRGTYFWIAARHS